MRAYHQIAQHLSALQLSDVAFRVRNHLDDYTAFATYAVGDQIESDNSDLVKAVRALRAGSG
ncbi:hypothetical protein [Paenarthrobacter nicotinovorans]|uniref:hypothetical protein n=1 Tax=Paenarthrobacter nicotinovorans TaxID=29320 RepID=UPI0011A22C23|nr:hypothetical protein [Paenarthrobacter nicotinovorans]